MRKILLAFSVLFLFFSCKNTQVGSTVELIKVQPLTSESVKTAEMVNFLAPFQDRLSQQMDKRLAFSAQTMSVGRPESLLSNLVCDVLLHEANSFLKTDFAVYNVGGLRKSLPQGNVTLRTIYEILPFDNQLVILKLSGGDVEDLCQSIAKVGGEGVAGITFCIEDGTAKDIRIQGRSLDKNRMYNIATNDYLSFGNDKMEPLSRHIHITHLNLQVRSVFINYITDLEQRGEKITSKLDGRIYEK